MRVFFAPIAVDLVMVLLLDSIKAQFEVLGFHIPHDASVPGTTDKSSPVLLGKCFET